MIQPTEVNEHPLGGEHKVYFFKNGYGASVVNNQYAYGGLELAVMRWTSRDDWDLTYNTPVTDDVLGYLTPETLQEALEAISVLPSNRPKVDDSQQLP